MSFHDACFEEIRIHVLKQKHTHIYIIKVSLVYLVLW